MSEWINHTDACIRHSLREIQRLAGVESEFDYYIDLDELVEKAVNHILSLLGTALGIPTIDQYRLDPETILYYNGEPYPVWRTR